MGTWGERTPAFGMIWKVQHVFHTLDLREHRVLPARNGLPVQGKVWGFTFLFVVQEKACDLRAWFSEITSPSTHSLHKEGRSWKWLFWVVKDLLAEGKGFFFPSLPAGGGRNSSNEELLCNFNSHSNTPSPRSWGEKEATLDLDFQVKSSWGHMLGFYQQ